MKMKKILFVALSLLLLLAFGCSDDTNNSSVTNPNPNTVYPTGTVQGVITDPCSNLPIAGAVVDIGVARATTNSRGVYVMYKVPATSYIDQIDASLTLPTVTGKDDDDFDHHPPTGITIDTGYRGAYSATIDMTTATVGGVKATDYATYYYGQIEVSFASMEPTSGIISADNADVTPVLGLGNANPFYISKMTAGITGYAVDNRTLQPLSGYKVYLISRYQGLEGNSTTGMNGNKLTQIATTDATGKFVFTKLESNQNFGVYVVDTDTGAPLFLGCKEVLTGCNTVLYLTGANMIKVASTDVICPFPLSIKADGHANYADIAKEEITDGVNVVIKFSEPIAKTELNTGRGLLATFFSGSGAAQQASLYYDILVTYDGYKIGNIPHTLTWNEAMTELTVAIPAEALQPASVYSVKITSNRNLKDASGQALTASAGTFSSVDTCDSCEGCLGNDCISCQSQCESYTCGPVYINGYVAEYHFTTWGARLAGKVTDLRFFNYDEGREDDSQLDYDDRAALDWTSVDGAKRYNIYCRMIQWNSTIPGTTGCDPTDPTFTGQYHPYWLMNTTPVTGKYPLNFQGSGSTFPDSNSDWFEYVESWNIKLSYECYVKGVNADGIEGLEESNHVMIEDNDRPYITDVTEGSDGSFEPNDELDSIRVWFSEPMDEASIQNPLISTDPLKPLSANWQVNATAFQTGTGGDCAGSSACAMKVNYMDYDTYTKTFRVYFDDATQARLKTTAQFCAGVTADYVDVILLSWIGTGTIKDVAGNVLQDPSEHCTGTYPSGTCPKMLPVIMRVNCL